jgi:hypothetical protein
VKPIANAMKLHGKVDDKISEMTLQLVGVPYFQTNPGTQVAISCQMMTTCK